MIKENFLYKINDFQYVVASNMKEALDIYAEKENSIVRCIEAVPNNDNITQAVALYKEKMPAYTKLPLELLDAKLEFSGQGSMIEPETLRDVMNECETEIFVDIDSLNDVLADFNYKPLEL